MNLRTLKNKAAAEVANYLIYISCQFDASSVLQSDNRRKFVNFVIEEVAWMWLQVKIVHGKPWHSQSQGSVKRSNCDVEDMVWADERQQLYKMESGALFHTVSKE